MSPCPFNCESHNSNCFYDAFHPILIHRCQLCIRDFFVGLQKSKATLTPKAFPIYGLNRPDFLMREGESDFEN